MVIYRISYHDPEVGLAYQWAPSKREAKRISAELKRNAKRDYPAHDPAPAIDKIELKPTLGAIIDLLNEVGVTQEGMTDLSI